MTDARAPPTTEGSLETPSASPFARDVLAGLSARPRTLPAKYFYDEAGSRLFSRITQLEAYYPTRTERAILTDHAGEIVDAIGRDAALVEYGSGSSDKTRILLDALHARRTLAAYVPGRHLGGVLGADRRVGSARRTPACRSCRSPPTTPGRTRSRICRTSTSRVVVFFPGSTIGNFERAEAERFLRHVAEVAGPGGALLIGADQWKDAGVLRRAYDDPEGVTAAFNLNLLRRLNRELGGDADPDAWVHHVEVNEAERRVEMHLREPARPDADRLRPALRVRQRARRSTPRTPTSTTPARSRRSRAGAGLVRQRRWTDAKGAGTSPSRCTA